MARGFSLHIGLNAIDPAGYAGDPGLLASCENDAETMETLARSQGFTPSSLLTADATADAVLSRLEEMSQELTSGDVALVTYSGHGGSQVDTSGDEPDFRDETWCAFDRQILDDELFQRYSMFAPGTRILILSDSCHSGSVYKVVADARDLGMPDVECETKILERDVLIDSWNAQQELYEEIRATLPQRSENSLNASIILLSGCHDQELSLGDETFGFFTYALLQTWNQGAFEGDYRAFHRAIATAVSGRSGGSQQPDFAADGPNIDSFVAQRPFQIDV